MIRGYFSNKEFRKHWYRKYKMSSLSLFGVPYGVTASSPRSGAGDSDQRLPVPSRRDDRRTAK
jgi:hypothetical protein